MEKRAPKLTSILACILLSAQGYCQPNKIQISKLLIGSTVKLENVGEIFQASGPKIWANTGTAFFFSYRIKDITVPVIVTSAHVVKGATITKITFTQNDTSTSRSNLRSLIEVDNYNNENPWIGHDKFDLAILPIVPILNRLKQEKGKEVLLIPFEEAIIPSDSLIMKLSAIENILMLGYPKGFYDTKNNYPIVRRGITATPLFSDYNGNREFLADISMYEGSSGSPVVIFNEGSYSSENGLVAGSRILLVGIATQSINSQGLKSDRNIESLNPLNLAVVVKASVLLDFKSFFEKILSIGPQTQNANK